MKNLLQLLIAFSIASASIAGAASIVSSKHDLSANSTAAYKADSMGSGDICIYCHTPHNFMQNAPLWNRYPGVAPRESYKLYSSTLTMKNLSNRNGVVPNSVSALCLDCHDGSPLGAPMLVNKPGGDSLYNVIGPNGESGIAANRKSRIGPDISGHHPVNFNVTQAGRENGLGDIVYLNGMTYMKTDSTGKGMPLFNSGRGSTTLECASCHVVHTPAYPSFLRTTMSGNKLCLACHIY